MDVGLLEHGLRVTASPRLKKTCKVSNLSVLVVDLQLASVGLQGSRRSLYSKITTFFVFRLKWQTVEVAEYTSAKMAD